MFYFRSMVTKSKASMFRKAVFGFALTALIVCNWLLAVSLAHMPSVTAPEGEGSCVMAYAGCVSAKALQGEIISVPQCSAGETGTQNISSAKKLRFHSSGSRTAATTTTRNHYNRPQQSLFAKAGTAFVSSRAANYYVYALRHILC